MRTRVEGVITSKILRMSYVQYMPSMMMVVVGWLVQRGRGRRNHHVENVTNVGGNHQMSPEKETKSELWPSTRRGGNRRGGRGTSKFFVHCAINTHHSQLERGLKTIALLLLAPSFPLSNRLMNSRGRGRRSLSGPS